VDLFREVYELRSAGSNKVGVAIQTAKDPFPGVPDRLLSRQLPVDERINTAAYVK